MLIQAASGTIVTIGGTGEPGFAGDGGPAIEACLNEPKSLTLDDAGRLFIADSENHVIRRVDLETGLISTVAGRAPGTSSHEISLDVSERGSGEAAEEDLLEDPTATTSKPFVQLADLSGTVRFVAGTAPRGGRFQGDGGPAREATCNFPTAVAVDEDGNLYVADTMNHRVRKVDGKTGLITTIAGTGQHRCSGDGGPAVAAALNEPSALVVDRKDQLYIADQSNHRVRKVDLATGNITTVAGTGEAGYTGDGGLAAEAGLAGPSGLALGQDGALYIADTFNGRIRRVDPVSGVISTVAGDGGEFRYQGQPHEFSTSLSRPYSIALDRDGHLLITDSDSHLIRRWDCRQKIIVLVAGNGLAQFAGDGGPAHACSLNYPFGVAIDRRGNLYIADTFNHRIRCIAA